MSHGVPVASGNKKGGNIAVGACGFLWCAATIIVMLCQPAGGQQLDQEYILTGGSYALEQPHGMAASPRGEQIAISDPSANRIIVVDLQGRLVWQAGDQVDLRQPTALCFESESQILYAARNEMAVLRLYEEDPRVMDTVADLSAALNHWNHIDQIIPRGLEGFAVLNETSGEVAVFTRNWEFDRTIIKHGSSRGKVILPTSMCLTSSSKLIVTDRKNYPVQIFTVNGDFLFYGGWNQPSQQRGWEAVASAVDTRDFIWVADETNAQYRIYDQSGTEMRVVPFSNRSARTVAMLGTVDNRVVVLTETGSLLFYTLE